MLREGMGTTGGERMEALLGAIRTLRIPRIEVLEDVAGPEPDVSQHAPRAGAGRASSPRWFLMRTGDENLVWADLLARRVWVARPLGRAESFVHGVAHERLLSPRCLERAIREQGGGTSAPPKRPPGD